MKAVSVLLIAVATASLTSCSGREGPVGPITGLASTSTTTATANPSSANVVVYLVRGAIASIDAASSTIVVNRTTVSVPASATIRDLAGPLTFADLKVGDAVTARVTNNGGTFVATDVLVDDHSGTYADVTGPATGVTGTCPNLQFTVAGATVTTSQSTTVVGGCGLIVNGAPVRVTGVRQADGSVNASSVLVRPVEVAGAIGALQGSCPSIAFSLGSTPVSTSSSTIFYGRSCSQLTNGASASAAGYQQSDGSLEATAVSSRDVH